MERGVPIDWGATAVSWTREGRIIFTRVPRGYFSNFSNGTPEVVSKLWVMDADGGNQQPLDQTDLGQLTAAGCVVCPYPPNTGLWIVDPLAYWEPGP
jgi:hypothetical protein